MTGLVTAKAATGACGGGVQCSEVPADSRAAPPRNDLPARRPAQGGLVAAGAVEAMTLAEDVAA